MTREHLTAIILVVLFCRRTEALSMLVKFAAGRTYHFSCQPFSGLTLDVRRLYTRTRTLRGIEFTSPRQSLVTREGAGLMWTMSTKARDSLSSPGSRHHSCEDGDLPESSSSIPVESNTATSTPVPAGPDSARVAPAEEPWLTEAGARLRGGKLVAFPTETVYGLGANALSEEAVLKIFQVAIGAQLDLWPSVYLACLKRYVGIYAAKQRPLTDPLIVHVPDTTSALAIVNVEDKDGGGPKARRLLDLLGNKLWPGPLTLILKAAENVPDCITAGTGFVGVRCPAHPITRQLLSLAGVPVAAPSANRFGHVSPTQAAHVMEDLGESDIMILDGDASGACGLGIESTVAKIDVKNNEILILRMGGVTQDRIREVLQEGGKDFSGMSVRAGSVAGGKTGSKVDSGDEGQKLSPQKQLMEAEGQAPGQLLRHYSPDLDVFRVLGTTSSSTQARVVESGEPANLEDMARTSVVVDFAGQLRGLQASALAYFDLSVDGKEEEAAEGLFRALRWAERQPSAQRLLIAGLPTKNTGDLAAAVNDRIYRSASGKTIAME